MLTLYIGNKNYSSWSMRPWVVMRQRLAWIDGALAEHDFLDFEEPHRKAP